MGAQLALMERPVAVIINWYNTHPCGQMVQPMCTSNTTSTSRQQTPATARRCDHSVCKITSCCVTPPTYARPPSMCGLPTIRFCFVQRAAGAGPFPMQKHNHEMPTPHTSSHHHTGPNTHAYTGCHQHKGVLTGIQPISVQYCPSPWSQLSSVSCFKSVSHMLSPQGLRRLNVASMLVAPLLSSPPMPRCMSFATASNGSSPAPEGGGKREG